MLFLLLNMWYANTNGNSAMEDFVVGFFKY